MSLEGSFHARWASKLHLAARLPATAVYTGYAPPGTAGTYAILQRRRTVSVGRTNTGTQLEQVTLQVIIRDAQHEFAWRVAHQLVEPKSRGGFLRDDWSFDSTGRVLDVTLAGNSAAQTDKGLWEFVTDLVLLVTR